MFNNPSFIVKTISTLIGIAIFVFLLTIVISVFNNWKKRKSNSELNSKTKDYLKQHISNTENEYTGSYNYKIVGHPKLHLLRTVELDNYTSVYFSNNGSTIFNIDIDSTDVSSISIEPKDKIPNKSSGCIKFSTNNTTNNKIIFILSYSDERMNRTNKKFLFSVIDKKIEEIY